MRLLVLCVFKLWARVSLPSPRSGFWVLTSSVSERSVLLLATAESAILPTPILTATAVLGLREAQPCTGLLLCGCRTGVVTVSVLHLKSVYLSQVLALQFVSILGKAGLTGLRYFTLDSWQVRQDTKDSFEPPDG